MTHNNFILLNKLKNYLIEIQQTALETYWDSEEEKELINNLNEILANESFKQ